MFICQSQRAGQVRAALTLAPLTDYTLHRVFALCRGFTRALRVRRYVN